jgi:nicotinamidase/pyrazinamidase
MASYVFVCVDTQKDYFGGKYNIPNSKNILPNLQKLTEAARNHNVKVISTKGSYPSNLKDLSDTPDYSTTYPKHCIEGTEGSQFIDETRPDQPMIIEGNNIQFPMIHRTRNIVIPKNKFVVERNFKKEFAEPFEGNSYMESVMHNMGVPFMERPNYIIYGINVGPTALGLMRRGYEVHVVQDANIGFNGYPLRKDDIIPQQTAPQSEGGLLGQSTGMEYPAPEEDNAITFITTKDIIGG